MKNISPQLKFFINLAMVHSKIVRSFDNGLGNGVGFNDFIILYYLYHSPNQKMRRVDLAETISLTPSGITRMLLPMEKIGLIKREDCKEDARVSYVKLAPGGKRLLEEAMERAELKAEELLPATNIKELNEISEIFNLFSLHKFLQ